MWRALVCGIGTFPRAILSGCVATFLLKLFATGNTDANRFGDHLRFLAIEHPAVRAVTVSSRYGGQRDAGSIIPALDTQGNDDNP
jgi:hypothetical protein